MSVDPSRLTPAIDAIRAVGGDVSSVLDAWEVPLKTGAQVFVSVGANVSGRGDPYATWVVTLGRDGTPTSLERFESIACGPRKHRPS